MREVRPVFVFAALGVAGLALWRRKELSETARKLFPNRRAEELAIRRALNEAAGMGGLEADFLNAIAKVETGFRMRAINKSGKDGLRGGAWGPTQITEKTVRTLGYTGRMEAFTEKPELAALWTAKILNDHRKRKPLSTLADYIAAWNAGKDDADRNDDNQLEELPEKHITRADYLPKAKAALAYVQQTRSAYA